MTESADRVSTIPTRYELLRPVLEVLSDGAVRHRRVIYAEVARHIGLTDEQLAERLDAGDSRAHNRIGWAMSDLTRAKLIENASRGHFRITPAGHTFLESHATVALADLECIPAYVEYVPARTGARRGTAVETSKIEDQSPDDLIETGIRLIEDDTKVKLLERLRGTDPLYFEEVVRKLLVKMGYGRDGRMNRLHGSGDGGLDGVIDRDELGLSKIYIQAKRYAEDSTIGRPKIQEFVGALATRGASVGVFFTTSRFTREAEEAAQLVQQDVALVDGIRLTELMIKHRVGVQVASTVEIVKVDEDFFADE